MASAVRELSISGYGTGNASRLQPPRLKDVCMGRGRFRFGNLFKPLRAHSIAVARLRLCVRPKSVTLEAQDDAHARVHLASTGHTYQRTMPSKHMSQRQALCLEILSSLAVAPREPLAQYE